MLLITLNGFNIFTHDLEYLKLLNAKQKIYGQEIEVYGVTFLKR